MLIRTVMTRTPACCSPSDKLDAVAKLMLDHDCGEIPVCDGTKLVGVITDRDITTRAVAAGRKPTTVPVSEVMTKSVYVIAEDAKVDAALDLMNETLVRRLPVVDKAGTIVGIISHADLIAKMPTLEVARVLRTISRRTRKEVPARAY